MARFGSLLAVLALAACGPLGPISGGKLAGELVSAPVVDWSFTDAISTIEIETRPEAPYSVTVWCFRSGSALYVPSRNPRSKAWVHHVLADPRIRLRIDGKLYERAAVHVADTAEIEAIVPALLEKYQLEVPDSDARPDVAFFRIEPRGESRAVGDPEAAGTGG